ncbi:MAG: queuosine precursor transporter [Bacteroidota bacterium]
MDSFVNLLISKMNALPPEVMWGILLLVCFFTIISAARFFGTSGLYAYIGVVIVAANVQVLKAVQFSIYPEPVALGTILFASTYLATDILGEQFGEKAARKGVFIGFFAHLFFSIIMLLTLGFSPLTPEQAGEDMAWALPFHDHIAALFTLQFSLFTAGMAAYLTSQLYDVWFYGWLKKKMKGKHLWLRNNVSTMVSALIDNTVFSVLAWIVLSANPLPFKTVLVTYILGTYWLRIIIAALDTPMIYLAKKWKFIGQETVGIQRTKTET